MSVKDFITRQASQIMHGEYLELARKIKKLVLLLLLYAAVLPVVLALRLIRPWLLVRFCALASSSMGHFAANTELYLCEYDAGVNRPARRHIDLFYFGGEPISNQQLAAMWRRTVRIWPAFILGPVHRLNSRISGGEAHEIGTNTQYDRDVHNLLDRFPSHLQFNVEECMRGDAGLRAMGIQIGAPFICLTVRDSAYLIEHFKRGDYNYHNYRDSDVQNYVLAAEALADRGYYVIRMGVKVHATINSDHSKIIDYATNGMRSDFMDVYLGAKCAFCISVGTGFDSIPLIFRRPIVYVNIVPIGYLYTFRNQFIGICKHHFSVKFNRNLSLGEVFHEDAGFCLATSDYSSKGILLVENTPAEIRDVVIEMDERLKGIWQPHEDDDFLQQRFWEIFPMDTVDAYHDKPLHGEIRSRFGAVFLRNNRWWLQ